MGCFDYVNARIPCPKCGETVDGFQTKDCNCYLETVEPESVLSFYHKCESCGTWIEYTRTPAANAIRRQVPAGLAEIESLGFRLLS